MDWKSLIQFTLFSAFSTPPNFIWQSFLESMFPAQTLSPSATAIKAAVKNDEKELDREIKEHKIVETSLNKTNTVVKLFLDMTFGAYLNTVLFITGMAFLRGASAPEIGALVKRDTWPLITAGLKLWPAVSLIGFAFVPTVEMRSLLGNLAGFAWNIYLCLFATGE